MNIIFISDFFSDEIIGGAELCNEALLSDHLEKKYTVIRKKSADISLSFLEEYKNDFFIVANFMLLSEPHKRFLINNSVYVIYEHDHKYVKNNNPGVFPGNLAPEDQLCNLEFFKFAKYTLCQSSLHSEVVFKNTLLSNIVNLAGNIWSDQHLSAIEELIGKDRPETLIKHAILRSENKIKGTIPAVNYCYQKNLDFKYIETSYFEDLIKTLHSVEKLVFFPTSIETFSRLAVEARMLGCKLITNSKLGAASDGYLTLEKEQLLSFVRTNKDRIFQIFDDIIAGQSIKTFNIVMPRVDLICTFLDGEKYLENFLNFMISQDIRSEIDLHILDAGSVGREREIISKFEDKININYIRTTEKLKTSESLNLMLKESSNEYVGFICIDDAPLPCHASLLRKNLFFAKDIDLVYGRCQVSEEMIDRIDPSIKRYHEHSEYDFSKENMIKCLPGPMSLFKRAMIEKNGSFNLEMQYSNDWELWLRCVRSGSSFKRITATVGVYYLNPEGNSTTQDTSKKLDRHREEHDVFYEYQDVFGKENFNLYKDYFDSLIKVHK